MQTATEALTEVLFAHIDSPRLGRAEEAIRLNLLDTLGCGLYGATQPEADRLLKAADAFSPILPGSPQSGVRVWGTDKTYPADIAALLCGTLCHLRELDDVHYSVLHTGAVCAPAAVAVAIWEDRTLADLLRAFACGVEAMARISLGMDYANHRERGWHGTATCGAFGAAVATALLLDLDASQIVQALGLAGSRTGGTWAFAADGAMSKRLHPGLAAQSGMIGAYLAAQGVTGPRYILEHTDGGFYPTMSKSWSIENLLDTTEGLAIERMDYKPYAACKSVHASLEASIELAGRMAGRTPADIREVLVETSASSLRMAGQMYDPALVMSAQLSIPYGVALGLTGRTGDATDYAPSVIGDESLHRLAGKVVMRESEECNKLRRELHKTTARVTVRFEDGSELSAWVTDPLGTSGHPLGREGLVAKFRKLAGCALPAEKVSILENQVLNGPGELRVRDLSL